MKEDNWIVCNECASEFKVISSITNKISESYCPFCGSDIEDQIDEEYEFIEED